MNLIQLIGRCNVAEKYLRAVSCEESTCNLSGKKSHRSNDGVTLQVRTTIFHDK